MGEVSSGMEQGILAQIRKSDTRVRCSITTVRLEKAGAAMLEIIPRDVGTDQEGWAVGAEQIPVKTLEEGIIVGMEIQARE